MSTLKQLIQPTEIAEEAQLSPEEEKAKHLTQVKEDNKEISGFESKIRELRGKIELCQEEIVRCEDSIQDQDSEQVIYFVTRNIVTCLISCYMWLQVWS